MAWKKNSKKTRNYNFRNRKTSEQKKRQELTSLAYNLGLIDQGLKNTQSAITESYAKGVARASLPAKQPRKPLF